MSQSFKAPLQRVKQGDPLSAESWNAIIDNLQQLNQPKQTDDPLGTRAGDPPISEEENEEIEPAPTPEATTSSTWTETSRTTSTVRIEDPDDSEVYVEVERIDQMSVQDTKGNTQTWIFNNT